jgi:hypothetical protein
MRLGVRFTFALVGSVDIPSRVWLGITRPTEDLTEQKDGQRGWTLSLFAWLLEKDSHLFLPLDRDSGHHYSWSLRFRVQIEITWQIWDFQPPNKPHTMHPSFGSVFCGEPYYKTLHYDFDSLLSRLCKGCYQVHKLGSVLIWGRTGGLCLGVQGKKRVVFN